MKNRTSDKIDNVYIIGSFKVGRPHTMCALHTKNNDQFNRMLYNHTIIIVNTLCFMLSLRLLEHGKSATVEAFHPQQLLRMISDKYQI